MLIFKLVRGKLQNPALLSSSALGHGGAIFDPVHGMFVVPEQIRHFELFCSPIILLDFRIIKKKPWGFNILH